MSEQNVHILGPVDAPGGARHLRVYVPPVPLHGGGRDPRPRGLLCMFDGQNVFDDAPSYAGGWHLHDAVRRLAERGHPMPVVLGVDHGGERRIHELSPFPCRESEGRLNEMLDWLVGEVLPRVRREYGLSNDPARTAVGGSSLGGLAALYAHFRHPGAFGAVMSMSPSCWLANGRIEQYVAEAPRPLHSRIYVDAGTLEAGGSMAARARRVVEKLRARGWGPDALRWVEDREGTHAEAHWRRRAPGALRFLFNPRSEHEGREAHEERVSRPSVP